MPTQRMGRLWKFKKDEADEWVTADEATEQSKTTSKIITATKKGFNGRINGVLNA